MKTIYMDHAATTAMSKTALEEMLPYFAEEYGNPSAVYSYGQKGKNAIEKCRERIAKCIGAFKTEIYFTSGGTESDNWAIRSACRLRKNKGKHIISTEIEHNAVRKTLEAVARKHRILFHTDAVQAVGHIPIEVHKLGVDFLSVSAHKFNGPKGVGVLYCRIPTRLPAYLTGGGQEKEGRSGTENVPGIVGMTRALEEQTERMQSNMEYLYALSKRMDEKVLNIPGVLKTGDPEKRLPGLCSYVVEGIAHSVLLVNEMNTYGICISSGSACSAASQEASHVLLSLGIEKQLAGNSIRISLGMDNTEEDVDYAASMLEAAINKIRTEQASRAPRLEGRVADMAGGKEA